MFLFFFFFKQKTAYEMRISDWSSDVCSSDLLEFHLFAAFVGGVVEILKLEDIFRIRQPLVVAEFVAHIGQDQQARRDPQRQPGDVDDSISAVLGTRAHGAREIIAPHRPDTSSDRKSTRKNSSHKCESLKHTSDYK